MNLEFLSVLATDKVVLPALLYTPDKQTNKAAVWLHGMGDNGSLYNPQRMNTLGETLAEADIAFLALNNRGAHNAKRLKIADDAIPDEDRSYQGGTFYEMIAYSVKDIDGAAQLLKERGFTELYLIGHSTGANKICVYHAKAAKHEFAKYVLAAPGDDTGIFFTQLGEKKYWQALKYAAGKLETDPLKTMPKYTGMHPFSVQSAWDILNPDGDYNTFPYYEAVNERLGSKPLFREYQSIDRKTLVIIGEYDEFMATAGGPQGALDLFMKHTPSKRLKETDFLILPDADHSFHDLEDAFAAQVTEWLTYG